MFQILCQDNAMYSDRRLRASIGKNRDSVQTVASSSVLVKPIGMYSLLHYSALLDASQEKDRLNVTLTCS